MCGGPDIPAQDPRFAEASLRQVELAERQYKDYMAPGGDRDWMRSTANEAIGIYRRAGDSAQAMNDYQLSQMRRNDDRYWGVGVPFEDQLIQQVKDMDTEQYRQAQVDRALADTQTQVDNARQTGIRAMTRRGANPESGAYAGMMADGGRMQALAMATAANKTRLAAQQVGLSNKMQMYGGMKGLAGLGATSAQLALSANGQGAGTAGGMTGAVGSSLGANNAALGTAQAGMSAGISGYNNYYANSLRGAQIAAENDPMNTILGAGAGALMSWGTGKFF